VCGHAGASPRALAAAQERNDDVGGVNSAARQQGGGRQQPGPSGTLDLLERWILAGTLAGTKTRRSRSPHCLSVMSSVSHIQSKHQSCQCQKAQHASKVLHCSLRSLLHASCFTGQTAGTRHAEDRTHPTAPMPMHPQPADRTEMASAARAADTTATEPPQQAEPCLEGPPRPPKRAAPSALPFGTHVGLEFRTRRRVAAYEWGGTEPCAHLRRGESGVILEERVDTGGVTRVRSKRGWLALSDALRLDEQLERQGGAAQHSPRTRKRRLAERRRSVVDVLAELSSNELRSAPAVPDAGSGGVSDRSSRCEDDSRRPPICWVASDAARAETVCTFVTQGDLGLRIDAHTARVIAAEDWLLALAPSLGGDGADGTLIEIQAVNIADMQPTERAKLWEKAIAKRPVALTFSTAQGGGAEGGGAAARPLADGTAGAPPRARARGTGAGALAGAHAAAAVPPLGLAPLQRTSSHADRRRGEH
jgi:hypothetical protein